MTSLTHFQEQDYYNSALIRPPEDYAFYEGETRFTRLVVDSKDRNMTLFPTPNSYEVQFDDDIDDVVSAKLINISLPFSMYMINKYFKVLKVVQDENIYVINLVEGNYNETELADHMASQLSSVAGKTFTCTYNRIYDKFTFGSVSNFSMDFTIPNSLAMLLGFRQKVYESTSNSLTSEFRKNLQFNNYIVMSIDQFDLNKNTKNPLNKSFAVIPENQYSANIDDNPDIIKFFSPPIGRLAKLKISFCDRFGNPYDFQNIDHRFEILFKSHKQKRKYNAILKHHLK